MFCVWAQTVINCLMDSAKNPNGHGQEGAVGHPPLQELECKQVRRAAEMC